MKYLVLLCFALLSAGAFAQTEICNNGLDDDGDGLIDLNDSTDCVCTESGISLIPNASFEAYDYLPTGYSQMDAATGWIQATSATSDYFNHPSYNWTPAITLGLVPPPDGAGYVGCHIMTGYIEYVGACLSAPMVAGTPYQISFQTAAFSTNGNGDGCNNNVLGNTTIDLVIYGNASCAQMPVATTDCPTSANSSWMELGRVTYVPATSWSTVTIAFTPPVNIDVIMLGGPCSSDIPAGYDAAFGIGCYPYFVFDDLALNEADLFLNVNESGSFCAQDMMLLGNSSNSSGGTWQWYYEGVAINGETSNSLNVSGVGYGTGVYNVSYIDTSGECLVATVDLSNYISVEADYLVSGLCIGEESNFTASATSNDTPLSYQWNFGDNTTSSNENPAHTYVNTGNYQVQLLVTSASGCQDSISTIVTIHSPPDVYAGEDVFLCEYSVTTFMASGAETYVWNNGAENGIEFAPVSGIYIVTGTDKYGCVNSDSLQVEVLFNAITDKVPNVFTPDGDSMNDIYTTDIFKECTSFECTIYNRWGIKLYQTNDVLINWAPGSIEEGVYFATIFYTDCSGKQEKHEQHITIFQ